MVITRQGKPSAVVLGLESYDEEDLRLAISPEFWNMIQVRRQGRSIPLAEVKARLGLAGEGYKMATGLYRFTVSGLRVLGLGLGVLPASGVSQRRPDDFAAELGLAAVLLVHAVEHRAGIEPDGQAVQVFGREFHVVMALGQQLRRASTPGPRTRRASCDGSGPPAPP